MNGFVYAISSILLALLTVVAIDAYLIFIASTPGQWQDSISSGTQSVDGTAAYPGSSLKLSRSISQT